MPQDQNQSSQDPAEQSSARLALNVDVGEIRREEYDGVEHVVVSAVAVVEGLMWAQNAPEPEYVPAIAFSKHVDAWNGRPVVLNHPQVDGQLVSANSPAVLEGEMFGVLFNTAYEEEGSRLTKETKHTQHTHNPVSYTHLTLPTNREV